MRWRSAVIAVGVVAVDFEDLELISILLSGVVNPAISGDAASHRYRRPLDSNRIALEHQQVRGQGQCGRAFGLVANAKCLSL